MFGVFEEFYERGRGASPESVLATCRSWDDHVAGLYQSVAHRRHILLKRITGDGGLYPGLDVNNTCSPLRFRFKGDLKRIDDA